VRGEVKSGRWKVKRKGLNASQVQVFDFLFTWNFPPSTGFLRNKKALGVAEGLEISVNRYYAATPGT
jgi:hypothetical protein